MFLVYFTTFIDVAHFRSRNTVHRHLLLPRVLRRVIDHEADLLGAHRQDFGVLRPRKGEIHEVPLIERDAVVIRLGEGDQGVAHRDETAEKEAELVRHRENTDRGEKTGLVPRKAVGREADGITGELEGNHVVKQILEMQREGSVRRVSGTAGDTAIAVRKRNTNKRKN